jgi:hypothetical protein
MTTLRITTRLKIREGRPSTGAPSSRTLDPGDQVTSVRTVTGEVVRGNDDWYELAGNTFIWSGGARPETANDRSPDPADEDRPSRVALGDRSAPVFEPVPGILHPAQGRRPNGLEGMIVHFDAYRIRAAGNGPEDSDRRAKETLATGENNGFHYAAVSRTGRIFVPEHFDFIHWGSHAGKSLCPLTGRTGVSRFYVGFELNNPGKLYPTADPNVFCPWFNVVVHPPGHPKAGQPILNAQGQAKRRSAADEWYNAGEVRFARGGNIQAGWYLPYSADQFEAITDIALYLADKFPSFSLDKVFGHDEVSPGRKNDPGGCMAMPGLVMTMEKFREHLKAR